MSGCTADLRYRCNASDFRETKPYHVPLLPLRVRRLTEGEHAQGPPFASWGLRVHLAFCQDCTRYLVQIRAVQAALAALKKGGVAPETRVQLGQRFRAWHAGLGTPRS